MPPTVHLPYEATISERIRKVFKEREVFKYGPTLLKDHLPMLCTYRNVCIGETTHQLKTYLKDVFFINKSAICKYAWTEDRLIRWDALGYCAEPWSQPRREQSTYKQHQRAQWGAKPTSVIHPVHMLNVGNQQQCTLAIYDEVPHNLFHSPCGGLHKLLKRLQDKFLTK